MQHINKLNLRKIRVLEEQFLWKRGHLHVNKYQCSECVELVIIYLQDYKNTPLKLYFRQDDNIILKNTSEKNYWYVGYPDDGVIWNFNQVNPQEKGISINLNRPGVIAKLIEYFFNITWFPKEAEKGFIVNDALKLLEIIEFPNGIN